MRTSFSSVAVVAGVLVCGVLGAYVDAGAQQLDLKKLQELLGNQNFDPSGQPENVQENLTGISEVVSDTKDCSAAGVQVTIPEGWRCRKLNDNPEDVTLHTSNNTLNLTIGLNQGKSSCDVIPTCTESKDKPNLGENFVDTRELVQPMVGSIEIVATYAKNPKIKLLITSNDAITDQEREGILAIVGSIEQQ